MVNKDTAKKWAIGAVVAAIAGYVAGVLTAPKSGKETRQDIKDSTKEGLAKLEARLKAVQSEVSQISAKVKENASTFSTRVRDEINTALDKVNFTKDKAKEILEKVKNGKSDNDDLQKAIIESEKAISHLKKFFK